MNELLQQWLGARVNAPGTLGAGIRGADGTCVCQSLDDHFSAENIEKILHQLAQALPLLSESDLASPWNTWVFEQGKIRCVTRPDGLLLGIAVRNDTDAAQNLDLLATEFLALQF